MLTTVKGTYDHGQIILHEIPSIQEGTEVLVTFLEQEPSSQKEVQADGLSGKKGIRFGSLAGKISIPENFNEPL